MSKVLLYIQGPRLMYILCQVPNTSEKQLLHPSETTIIIMKPLTSVA